MVIKKFRLREVNNDNKIYFEFRNQGIGRKLIEVILRELKDIHIISLFCDENDQEFYFKNNF
jgi:GNAT superfamily N-acetyltransferase